MGVFGNTQGFTVRSDAGEEYYAPLAPEENTTWELGYKGVIGERLFLDATGYYADYTNFFSPLVIIANPFTGSVASFGTETAPILGETDNPQVVLTYFNLGEAAVKGVDLGARYVVSEKVGAKATFSVIELDSRDTGTIEAGKEATSLNSPGTKWTLSADVKDVRSFLGGATLRYVNGYNFRSGINVGEIPTFTTLDLMAGYDMERFNSQLMLNISNLFTCRSADTGISADDEAKCGFGVRHREMVNMPHIGTMIFLGVRVHR